MTWRALAFWPDIKATAGAEARKALDVARGFCREVQSTLSIAGFTRAGLIPRAVRTSRAAAKSDTKEHVSTEDVTTQGVATEDVTTEDEDGVFDRVEALIYASHIITALPGQLLDPAKVGPGRCHSSTPRHRMPLNLRTEDSNRV
jgi:hypothetical protein